MSKFPKDPVVCGSFYKLNKRYAKTRKKKRREFKQNILNHLDELQSNNPKEIWSLVNQLCNEQSDKSVSNIDGDTWYKYFSILASVPNNFKSRLHKIKNKLKLLEEGNISCSPLDFKITKVELQKAYSKLKSNKNLGLDNVSNEMLKVSQSYIDSCLLKLYNAVFTFGIYPAKWSESFIYVQYLNQRTKIILKITEE